MLVLFISVICLCLDETIVEDTIVPGTIAMSNICQWSKVRFFAISIERDSHARLSERKVLVINENILYYKSNVKNADVGDNYMIRGVVVVPNANIMLINALSVAIKRIVWRN